MIQDGRANHLSYAREKCVLGSQLFGRFVDLLFGLKKRGIVGAKEILTASWVLYHVRTNSKDK